MEKYELLEGLEEVFTPEDAQEFGAFEETALSEEDAKESDEIQGEING